MEQVEYRVRPVVRYVVTRWYSGQHPEGGNYGGCETIGEYDCESAAERVYKALEAGEKASDPRRQYAVVQSTFEPDAQVFYAYGLAEATATRDRLNAEGGEWRIFAKE